jgi:hypothetical protein
MSYVNNRAEELRKEGFYSARRVDSDALDKIINMDEVIYYELDTALLESYLGLLSQQVYYVQQECNIAEAREIEYGNDFKISALPLVLDTKIRSVEERWIFASTLTPELEQKFKLWQESIIEAILKKKISEPIIEKLYILKKVYDERRLEGVNRTVHNQANR